MVSIYNNCIWRYAKNISIFFLALMSILKKNAKNQIIKQQIIQRIKYIIYYKILSILPLIIFLIISSLETWYKLYRIHARLFEQ